MERLVATLTFGNPSAVKTVLASVAAALGVYQLVLIAIAYGKLRPRAVGAPVASFTHRASGDAILVVLVVVALFCLARFGLEDDGAAHAISGAALMVVLGLSSRCCAGGTAWAGSCRCSARASSCCSR
jgi:fumarate reductase subunit D